MSDGFDYERFFMLSDEIQVVAGSDMFFKRVNPAMSRVLGWTEAELLGRPFTELVHADDVQSVIDIVGDLTDGLPMIRFENRALCKDGSNRRLRWNGFKDKASGFLYGAARDISDEA